jgi:NitT/TauT family transport system permease protein
MTLLSPRGIEKLSVSSRTLIGIFLLGGAWEAAYRGGKFSEDLFPSLSSVILTTIEKWPVLAAHLWVTAYETLLGFVCAVIGGVIGAIILNSSRRLATVLWPIILFAQITPKVALAPILLIWLGYGILPKIIIAFLISFFPVLANAYAGFRSVDTETRDLARSMRCSRMTYFLRFQFPYALPRIFGGARIAITFAVVGTIVAEFVGSDRGLGYLTMLAARTLNSSLMVASILVLGLMGIVLFHVVGAIERRMIPWHISYRRQSLVDAVESRSLARGI